MFYELDYLGFDMYSDDYMSDGFYNTPIGILLHSNFITVDVENFITTDGEEFSVTPE